MSFDDYVDWLKDEADRREDEVSEIESLRSCIAKLELSLNRIYKIASRQLADPVDSTDEVAFWRICTEVESVYPTVLGERNE